METVWAVVISKQFTSEYELYVFKTEEKARECYGDKVRVLMEDAIERGTDLSEENDIFGSGPDSTFFLADCFGDGQDYYVEVSEREVE